MDEAIGKKPPTVELDEFPVPVKRGVATIEYNINVYVTCRHSVKLRATYELYKSGNLYITFEPGSPVPPLTWICKAAGDISDRLLALAAAAEEEGRLNAAAWDKAGFQLGKVQGCPHEF